MTINAAALTDITWADMITAGINIDHVQRQDARLDVDEYIGTNGDIRVAFGPYVDVDNLGDDATANLGWNVALYSWDVDQWIHDGQDWMASKADMLATVARVLA